MLEAIFINDDVISIRNLLCLTDAIKNIRCIGTSNNIKNGIALVKTLNPDIVFLSISLVKSSDSDLLSRLQYLHLNIIYVTSHSDQMEDKVELIASDKILKPECPVELKKVIGRYLKNQNEGVKTNPIQASKTPEVRKIPIHTCTGIEVFDIETIVRFQSCGNYCMVYFENGRKIISSKSLKKFEELLSKYDFIRINRQDLVHTRFIRKIFKGRYPILELINNERLKVSDRKRKVVRKLLVNN